MFSVSIRGVRAAMRGAACAALLFLPATAHAEWVRAESTNFIAYSEGTPEDLEKRVANLEKFGHVLQAMTGARRPKEVPVKITVYFVRTVEEVGETLPFPVYGVAGYYNTTMRGPFTVMPRQDAKQPSGTRYRMPPLGALQVLQHELTHHFMFQYFPGAYPSWYIEGFADYAGAIEIGDDNVVKVGLFLQQRAQLLRSQSWIPLRQLMNPDPRKRDAGIEIYSQGWITVHYLNSTPEGRKKLRAYLAAINGGASFEKALEAFGDIDALNAEVRAYARLSKLPAEATKYLNLDPGPIVIKKLAPVEEALVEKQISMSSGVDASKVQSFARDVRDIVKTDPDNPYARRMLIEAERMAGNDAESRAAIARWLATEPKNPWANYFLGDLDAKALAEAKSTDAKAWAAARGRIELAMAAMPNEPRFARAYYESWLRAGMLPPAKAQNHLSRALDLIPRENSLRLMVARDYEARGMIDDAIYTIAPLAYGIADESEKDKRRRERAQEQYRTAEDEDDKETPREMLARLLEKQAATPAKPAAKPAAQ